MGFEHGQIVEREPYDLPFGQRKAPDGTALGRPPGAGRKAGDIYARLLAAGPHATSVGGRGLAAPRCMLEGMAQTERRTPSEDSIYYDRSRDDR